MGVLHILHKGVLLLSQHMFIHQTGMAQYIRRQLLDAVDGIACASN